MPRVAPQPLPGLPLAVSVIEAARQLGVSKNTIYAMEKRGAIRIIRLGETNRAVVPTADLLALLEGNSQATQ